MSIFRRSRPAAAPQPSGLDGRRRPAHGRADDNEDGTSGRAATSADGTGGRPAKASGRGADGQGRTATDGARTGRHGRRDADGLTPKQRADRNDRRTEVVVMILGVVLSVGAGVLASSGQIEGGLHVQLEMWRAWLVPLVTDVSGWYLLLSWWVQRRKGRPAGGLLFLAALVTGYGVWLSYDNALTHAQGHITGGASAVVFILIVAKLWHSTREVAAKANDGGLLFTLARWLIAPRLSWHALVLRIHTSTALHQAQMYRAVYQSSRASGAGWLLSRWRARVSVMPSEVQEVALASPRAKPKVAPDAPPSVQPSHLPVQAVHTLDGTGRPHLVHLPSAPDGPGGRAPGRADGRVQSARALPSAPSSVPAWQQFTPAQVDGFRREFAPEVAKIKAAIADWATRDQIVPSMETEIAVYAGVTSRRAQQKIQAVFGADRADVEPVHRAAVS